MRRVVAFLIIGILLITVLAAERVRKVLPSHVDYLIVGAGPAGLQWALELESHGVRSYMVLEKEQCAGSFFQRVPWNRQLISVNKNVSRRMSAEFELRHDWHSLLGTSKRMGQFSQDYHPHADELVKYLGSVARDLKVVYKTRVQHVEYGLPTLVTTTRGVVRCRHLIVATGYVMRAPPAHYTDLSPSTPIVPYDRLPPPQTLRHKRIMVIGSGNAALETASTASQFSYRTVLIGKPPRLSVVSHYPGDVRLRNLTVYDQYLLKSLDVNNLDYTFFESAVKFRKERPDFDWDAIFYCGGFTTEQPGLVSVPPGEKYPAMRPFYQHVDHDNVWYAGCLMHRFDYRKSAGGFIHGFRYLIRAQVRYILHVEGTHQWPVMAFEREADLNRHLLERIRTSSGLYQMQSELCDVIVSRPSASWIVLEEVPIRWASRVTPRTSWLTLNFEYGDVPWTFNLLFSKKRVDKKTPRFLHPVLRRWKDGEAVQTIRLSEDVLSEWVFPAFETELFDALAVLLSKEA